MCANPITQSDAPSLNALGMDSLHTTAVFNNLKTEPGTAGLKECLICPECQTINHLGWLFCPQCGKEVDTSFLQAAERPDEAPTIETLVSELAPAVDPMQTVAARMQSKDSWPMAGNHEHAPPILQQPPQWPLEPQPRGQSTSPREQPMQQPINATSASANNFNGGADKDENASAPADEFTTVACTECRSENSSDYSFCLHCGANLPVTKTIVMASIAGRVMPRLRLLVQDEESGPTYQIKDEARIGRTEGSITFPHDNFLSTSHARIVKRGPDFILIDEASSNGTFIKVKRETKLEPGDVILVGGQLLRFEA